MIIKIGKLHLNNYLDKQDNIDNVFNMRFVSMDNLNSQAKVKPCIRKLLTSIYRLTLLYSRLELV